jgi:hypothetical protein
LCAHLDVDLHHMPIVGFNIQEFDLPFLWARCAVHGLLPDLPAPRDYRRVGELRSILTKGTLSDWMMSFGFDGKPGPAVEVANINELADRCRHDVTVTRQLGERLRGALSCLN